MKDFRLYLVLDVDSLGFKSLENTALGAIRGGCDIIQLRAKNTPDYILLEFAHKLRKITRQKKIPFIINNRPDIALCVEADGVHLGQDDIPLICARKILGKHSIIGVSCHSLPQALKAQREDADYVGIGPVFKTQTHPDYRPVGLKLISEVNKRITIPFVAIGGINKFNVRKVLSCDAKRVAVCKAICGTKDPYIRTRQLAGILKEYK